MKKPSEVNIEWPNGTHTKALEGDSWLHLAREAGISIPTGCLGGRCGACEVEVNGKVIRSCISSIPLTKTRFLKVEFISDPSW